MKKLTFKELAEKMFLALRNESKFDELRSEIEELRKFIEKGGEDE